MTVIEKKNKYKQRSCNWTALNERKKMPQNFAEECFIVHPKIENMKIHIIGAIWLWKKFLNFFSRPIKCLRDILSNLKTLFSNLHNSQRK